MDPAAQSASSAAAGLGTGEVVRDNYIPIFDGRPSSYKEWRKRIVLYQKKMVLAKRPVEGVINLLTSFTGPVWKQVEHLSETASEQEDGFKTILTALDRIYQYDDKVEMPKAFERFFYNISRSNGVTLLAYCSDHREAARELEKYNVKLPDAVSGWLLMRHANLTPEQRQLVMSQVPKDFTPEKIEEAMFYLFGQDYKGKHHHDGAARPRPGLQRARPVPTSVRWVLFQRLHSR